MTLSTIYMPVIPAPENLFEDEKELYTFLLNFQDKHTENAKIISFSQKIQPIDPLAVLEALQQTNQLHFYWENPSQQEAIIGYGITKHTTIDSADRFRLAEKFMQDCLKQTISSGDLHLKGSGPHFFCSFTFFPQQDKESPFPSATIFLPRFQIYRKNEECVLVINLAVNKKINIKYLEKITQQIQALNRSSYKRIKIASSERFFTEKNHNPERFKSSVNSALKLIKEHKFSKIVIADTLDVVSHSNFNIIESLYNLRQRHPDCYIFSISNGKGDNFIGASPERLLTIENQQLVTDALAGSAPRGKTQQEDAKIAQELLTSEKERREHQAVSKFIVQRLQQLGLQTKRSPIKLLQLSNIQHLWTPIYAQIPNNINLLEIVAGLHPTPAVAGVPTEAACEEIRRYETFNRSLYAAPLGWIDYQGNGKFIVGIRSALIRGNQARLYAGAGIVAGSDAEKEFAEVQLKLQSLLKALT